MLWLVISHLKKTKQKQTIWHWTDLNGVKLHKTGMKPNINRWLSAVICTNDALYCTRRERNGEGTLRRQWTWSPLIAPLCGLLEGTNHRVPSVPVRRARFRHVPTRTVRAARWHCTRKRKTTIRSSAAIQKYAFTLKMHSFTCSMELQILFFFSPTHTVFSGCSVWN